MNIITAAIAGLALAAALAVTPTADTAPTIGVTVAAQHAAIQTGIDTAGGAR